MNTDGKQCVWYIDQEYTPQYNSTSGYPPKSGIVKGYASTPGWEEKWVSQVGHSYMR